MSMHKLFEKHLFDQNIYVKSQYVKLIQFFTPLGQDFDFNSENLKLDYKYHVLNNKENGKDYIVILEFSIIETNIEDEEQNCILNVIVEGIYNLNKNINIDNEIESAKHYGSLSLLVSYLRTVIFNITALTVNGGVYLPLIDINELHKKNVKKIKPKKTKKPTENK